VTVTVTVTASAACVRVRAFRHCCGCAQLRAGGSVQMTPDSILRHGELAAAARRGRSRTEPRPGRRRRLGLGFKLPVGESSPGPSWASVKLVRVTLGVGGEPVPSLSGGWTRATPLSRAPAAAAAREDKPLLEADIQRNLFRVHVSFLLRDLTNPAS
jgi:hypothetical protein